jgi:hypothetical protein
MQFHFGKIRLKKGRIIAASNRELMQFFRKTVLFSGVFYNLSLPEIG